MKYKYLTIITALITGIVLTFYLMFLIRFDSYEESGPVKVYYADNISAAHHELINKFNAIYTGKIEVVPIDLPFSKFSTNERKELLARSLRSKTEKIDIFAVDLIWVPRFAKWAESLDQLYERVDTSIFLQPSISTCRFNNEYVAFPLYLDIGIMYYRKDIIDRLPDADKINKELKNSITWEDFVKLSKRVHFKNKPFFVFPGEEYEGFMCTIIELLNTQNPNLFSNKQVDLSGKEAKKALQFLYDLVHKYHISPKEIIHFKENNAYKYFVENDGVFLRGWPSFDKDYKNIPRSDNKPIKYEKAALPHFAGTNEGSVYGGWDLMVSKWSNHKKEAKIFLNFLLRPKNQEILWKTGGYLPTLKSFYSNKEIYKEYPDLVYLKDRLNHGIFRPFREDYTRISDIISYYFNEVIEGNYTVDDALKFTNSDIKSGKIIIK